MKKRKVNWVKQIGIRLCLAFLSVVGGKSMAQSIPTPSDVAYVLLSGSQLLDDCPICDHIPMPVAIYGNFQLHLKEVNPLFATYELLDISFHTDQNAGRQYTVNGRGIYEYGGPMAVIQDASLSIRINDGFKNTMCYCTNSVRGMGSTWPEVQINVDQTNGTPGQVYHLNILAAPQPRLVNIIPESKLGNIRLEWTANGHKVQLEKAENVDGPYTALSPVTSDETYTDLGSLSNRTQSYYRLRKW